MIEDRQIIEMLRDDRQAVRTLDPQQVAVGGRRRRTRSRATAGLTSAAVAAVAVTGFIAAMPEGGSSVQPPVAGSGGPSATTTGRASQVPARPQTTGTWIPGGPVGAKPIGTIPQSGRVALFDGYWFETKGTTWCITERDETGNLFEPFGCRGTVDNSNIVPGLSNYQATGKGYTTSVFKGDARRVLYTVDNKYYEAKLYRLAAVPGWLVAVARVPSSSIARLDPVHQNRAVFEYDRHGDLIGRFPSAKEGPTTDPLHP